MTSGTQAHDFSARLAETLVGAAQQSHVPRPDYFRFPQRRLQRIRALVSRVARESENRFWRWRRPAPRIPVRELLRELLAEPDLLEVYQRLNDEYSRDLFVKLLAFSRLGPHHVTIPPDNRRYWAAYDSVDQTFLRRRDTAAVPGGWRLNYYEIQGRRGRLELHAHPLNVLNTFLLEQYVYRWSDPPIGAQPGDVVIDAGACWGDTALYFADRVGPRGRVYCFEFFDDNLSIFHQNLALNPSLRDVVDLSQYALWHRSGESMGYAQNGPATRLQPVGNSPKTARTLSIDDFVAQREISRVDFIKMDIEGAELAALRGAVATLRSHRPRLAIAAYHGRNDLSDISRYLSDLGLGYRLWLDHFTTHREETILFAAAPVPETRPVSALDSLRDA
jgi:FkbM family methyltransferase